MYRKIEKCQLVSINDIGAAFWRLAILQETGGQMADIESGGQSTYMSMRSDILVW